MEGVSLFSKLRNGWYRARRSIWALPVGLLLLAVMAAIVMPYCDAALNDTLRLLGWRSMSAEGARTILSSIASATITVAGVVFSITMVMLSIASSQFGTRVLRNRVRERSSQVAVGVLLGAGVYSLIVLGSVNSGELGAGVPHLSVALAIVLAVASLIVVVVFIHDVSNGIQAPRILASLARDLDDSIERMFPEKVGAALTSSASEVDDSWRPQAEPFPAAAEQDGYVQTIDGDALMRFARRHDLLIHLTCRPGDFISRGNPVAEVWGETLNGDADARQRLVRGINETIVAGEIRTPEQDVNCAVHELAQVAVRALSPGINDPFTAMNAIDRLAAALGRLAERRRPERLRFDDEGRLRLVAEPVTFAEALAAAYNQIRHYGKSSIAVCVRLLEAFDAIAPHVKRDQDRRALLYQARMLMQAVESGDHVSGDLDMFRKDFAAVLGKFPDEGGAPDQQPPSPAPSSQDERQRDADRNDPEMAAKGEVNG